MFDIVSYKPIIDPQELGFSEFVEAKTFHIVQGTGDAKKNRTFLRKGVHILMSPEQGSAYDKTHYRNSGMDQAVLADLKRMKIAVGFSLQELFSTKSQEKRAQIMGRMMQNIKLCRKYKIPLVLCTLAKNKYQLSSKEDLRSLGRVLGMAGNEVNTSLNYKIPEKGIKVVK